MSTTTASSSRPKWEGGTTSFYDSRDLRQLQRNPPRACCGSCSDFRAREAATPLLTVSGTATLDGALQFRSSGFIPTGGYLEWVLHARGGIVGQFANWSTAGNPLFITGELRHGANDVYLLASRVSTQAVMASAAAGDALTLDTATRIDAAFAAGDTLATAARRGTERRATPASFAQPLRSRTSATTARRLPASIVFPATRICLRRTCCTRRPRHPPHATRRQAAGITTRHARSVPGLAALRNAGGLGGHYSTDGQASGYDQWLTPQWLVGSSVSHQQGQMQLERMGGARPGRVADGKRLCALPARRLACDRPGGCRTQHAAARTTDRPWRCRRASSRTRGASSDRRSCMANSAVA